MNPKPMSFKDRHREMQEMVRELLLLRNHNLQFKEGDPQDKMLLIAEGALAALAMERFIRIVLGNLATDEDTLYNLLEKAVSRKLVRVPFEDQAEGIKKICRVRNTLLHANYEQAAQQTECGSAREYLKEVYAAEVESMTGILDAMMQQVDVSTGRPKIEAE